METKERYSRFWEEIEQPSLARLLNWINTLMNTPNPERKHWILFSSHLSLIDAADLQVRMGKTETQSRTLPSRSEGSRARLWGPPRWKHNVLPSHREEILILCYMGRKRHRRSFDRKMEKCQNWQQKYATSEFRSTAYGSPWPPGESEEEWKAAECMFCNHESELSQE